MKKQTAKDRIAERKRAAEAKKQQFRQDDITRRENAEKDRIAKEEEKRIQEQKRELAAIEKENPEYAAVKKSRVKAAGLKSVFVLQDNKLLMTAFGKGNEANPDKYVQDEVITDAAEDTILSVEHGKPGFQVSGRMVKNAETDNPLKSSKVPGMDQIRCKGKLEHIFFGQEFEDNIHIQLIYSILDIQKILTVHVNNIVFELDNLLRAENEEHDDLIGYLGGRKDYESFKKYKNGELYQLFRTLLWKKQMAYFGDTFVMPQAGKKRPTDEEKEVFEKRCYYLFVILGIVRQATAHGDEKNMSQIYNLDESTKILNPAKAELDSLYADRIQSVNASFLANAGKNLYILSKVFSLKTAEEKAALTEEFYSYEVLKAYKNLGFSIKRVRENLELVWPEMKNQEYDTVRRKMNRLLDFIIWRHYINQPELLSKLVEKLRAADRESKKELIYRKAAADLWKDIEHTVRSSLLPYMKGDAIRDITEQGIESELIDRIRLSDEADIFSKMIYFLTIFLDGKEINDLLTQLISGFDNIHSFLQVAKAEGINTDFVSRYSMFAKSDVISKELRVINSFARMSKEPPAAKKALFAEAAELLGYDSRLELDKYLDDMLGGSTDELGNKKEKKGFRNFIINNVIESDRFKYLVRYGNPKKVKKIACNREVVLFVLKEIPDAQILFYYNSCNGVKREYVPTMREDLADKITGLSFTDFENMKKGNIKDAKEAEEKERKKNVVRLYLTVLYLLVKNLVYVNARYYLAFHCQERDSILYDSEKYKNLEDRRQFAVDFVHTNSVNTRAKRYIEQNYGNSDAWASRAFRNCAEHMTAVRNMDLYIGELRNFSSYFEIYHYLVQRTIMDQYKWDTTHESKRESVAPGTMILNTGEVNPKLGRYFELVEKYHCYCKDLVKALNIPFAYNLARYKNLSINELFDRNHYVPNTKERIETEEGEDE